MDFRSKIILIIGVILIVICGITIFIFFKTKTSPQLPTKIWGPNSNEIQRPELGEVYARVQAITELDGIEVSNVLVGPLLFQSAKKIANHVYEIEFIFNSSEGLKNLKINAALPFTSKDSTLIDLNNINSHFSKNQKVNIILSFLEPEVDFSIVNVENICQNFETDLDNCIRTLSLFGKKRFNSDEMEKVFNYSSNINVVLNLEEIWLWNMVGL